MPAVQHSVTDTGTNCALTPDLELRKLLAMRPAVPHLDEAVRNEADVMVQARELHLYLTNLVNQLKVCAAQAADQLLGDGNTTFLELLGIFGSQPPAQEYRIGEMRITVGTTTEVESRPENEATEMRPLQGGANESSIFRVWQSIGEGRLTETAQIVAQLDGLGLWKSDLNLGRLCTEILGHWQQLFVPGGGVPLGIPNTQLESYEKTSPDSVKELIRQFRDYLLSNRPDRHPSFDYRTSTEVAIDALGHCLRDTGGPVVCRNTGKGADAQVWVPEPPEQQTYLVSRYNLFMALLAQEVMKRDLPRVCCEFTAGGYGNRYGGFLPPTVKIVRTPLMNEG